MKGQNYDELEYNKSFYPLFLKLIQNHLFNLILPLKLA